MMKTKTYVLRSESGHIAIMRLLEGADYLSAIRKFTEVSFRPVHAEEIDPAIIPPDTAEARRYRDAWTYSGGAFGHDMAKARNIHRDQIRAARAERFKALDAAMLRAIEQGKPTGEIAKEKAALRDATADPLIDAASSVEELAAVWPPTLEVP